MFLRILGVVIALSITQGSQYIQVPKNNVQLFYIYTFMIYMASLSLSVIFGYNGVYYVNRMFANKQN